jgi:hypothetical protein
MGVYLLKFGWFPVRRHVLVRGTASPDDPHLRAYWQQRTAAKAADHSAKTQRLARRQGQVCPVCNESLFHDEELHTHHIQPRQQGRRTRRITCSWSTSTVTNRFTGGRTQSARPMSRSVAGSARGLLEPDASKGRPSGSEGLGGSNASRLPDWTF